MQNATTPIAPTPGEAGIFRQENMNLRVTPFLMFEGKAEEAMNFYVSLFPDSTIGNIVRYGPAWPARRVRSCGQALRSRTRR